jgi:hypothetical protein
MAAQERAKGRCPDCGRVISGRATGIEYDHADRRFVALRPHNREERGRTRHPVECLARGGRRVVPRIRD